MSYCLFLHVSFSPSSPLPASLGALLASIGSYAVFTVAQITIASTQVATVPNYGVRGTPAEAVYVKSARCGRTGCNKAPSFGVSGTKKARFCVTRAPEGMVDVVQRRCSHLGCKKLSCYGISGSSKELCSRHVQGGVVNPRCMAWPAPQRRVSVAMTRLLGWGRGWWISIETGRRGRACP